MNPDPLDVTDEERQRLAWLRAYANEATPRMVVVPPRRELSLLPAFLVITIPLCLFWFVVGVAVGARLG